MSYFCLKWSEVAGPSQTTSRGAEGTFRQISRLLDIAPLQQDAFLIAVAALHHPVLNPPEAARLAFFLLFSCVYQRLHHLFWNIFFPAEAETAVVFFFFF